MGPVFVDTNANVFLYVLNKGYLMCVKMFIKLKMCNFTAGSHIFKQFVYLEEVIHSTTYLELCRDKLRVKNSK